MSFVTKTPPPPYYAVIFSSLRSEGDNGYGEVAKRVVELAYQQKGFLGAESIRNDKGEGITISYWDSLEAIEAWKNNGEHMGAQSKARLWYEAFGLRVVKVERDSFL